MGQTGDFYFLVAGRWFKAGRWTVRGRSRHRPPCQPTSSRFQVEHPRSQGLPSVPGTPQATESRIARVDAQNCPRQ